MCLTAQYYDIRLAGTMDELQDDFINAIPVNQSNLITGNLTDPQDFGNIEQFTIVVPISVNSTQVSYSFAIQAWDDANPPRTSNSSNIVQATLRKYIPPTGPPPTESTPTDSAPTKTAPTDSTPTKTAPTGTTPQTTRPTEPDHSEPIRLTTTDLPPEPPLSHAAVIGIGIAAVVAAALLVVGFGALYMKFIKTGRAMETKGDVEEIGGYENVTMTTGVNGKISGESNSHYD